MVHRLTGAERLDVDAGRSANVVRIAAQGKLNSRNCGLICGKINPRASDG
jgi:hypothetical protein